MNAVSGHWDPVQGTISVETDDISQIKTGITLPAPVRRFLPIAALAAMLWTFVQGFLSDGFPFIPVAVTTVLFGAFIFAAELENEDGRKTLRRVRLARQKGWTYTGKLMERVMAYKTAWSSDGAERRAQRVKSERARAVETLVPELTKLQVGAFMGAEFDGEFWGKSTKDDLPFWMAIGAMQMEAGLAADKSLREDAHGGKGGFGVFFSLLGAYRIGRKTGVRAVIRPENLVNRGPLDRDIKTESVQFNAAFNITGTAKSGDENAVEHDILRILTPATQATMLDLLQRYHNVGFVVDDDVLFFMAQDRLVGRNANPDRIDTLLAGIAADFEEAKFAIKRYVE